MMSKQTLSTLKKRSKLPICKFEVVSKEISMIKSTVSQLLPTLLVEIVL